MHPADDSPRVRFLRLRWNALLPAAVGVGADAHEAPIAIYGGGRHTRWIIETLRLHESGPQVGVVIDDHARDASREIGGIPVVRPVEVDPSAYAAVVVSSDSIEERLAARARLWAGRAASPPEIAPLYAGVLPGPYDASHDEMFETLAAALRDDPHADLGALTEASFGPYTEISRIAAALPEPRIGDGMPIPPRGRRSGYDLPDAAYLASGRRAAERVLACVREHAGDQWSPRDILDWGCSSGRVLRHMPSLVPDARCQGCDIDAWSIGWGAANLSPTLRMFRSTTSPHLPLPDSSLDLVYAISVFTHMSDHWDTWLMELRRTLRPGGFLFASINDENVWAACGRDPGWRVAQLCPRLDFTAPMKDDFVCQGRGPHAQSFWHTRGVRRHWSFAFEVLGFTPGLIDGGQTGVVLRRPE